MHVRRGLTCPLLRFRRLVWPFVQTFALVIADVRRQQLSVAPFLDRPGRDPKSFRHLLEVQQPTRAQPLATGLEAIGPPDALHAFRTEGPAFQRAAAAIVEDPGDRGIGIVFEQRVDFSDDPGRGAVASTKEYMYIVHNNRYT